MEEVIGSILEAEAEAERIVKAGEDDRRRILEAGRAAAEAALAEAENTLRAERESVLKDAAAKAEREYAAAMKRAEAEAERLVSDASARVEAAAETLVGKVQGI